MQDNISSDNYSQNENTLLLSRIMAGEEEAFSILYRKYANNMYAYGMGITSNTDSVHDAIQDVFYKLYTQKASLNNIDNIKFYLLRMMRNRLLDILENQQRHIPLSESENQYNIEISIDEKIIDKEDVKILHQKISKLLSTLNDHQREAIYLRFMQELEYDEIAQILQITPHAARKLVSRAIVHMRQEAPILLLLIAILHNS